VPLGVLLLFVSAFAQVAVCWIIATRPLMSSGIDLTHFYYGEPGVWRLDVPTDTPPTWITRTARPGWASGEQRSEPDGSEDGYALSYDDFGFPWRSMSHYHLGRVHWLMELHSTPTEVNEPLGYRYAATFRGHVLPLHVHPVPFVLNWLVYFAALSGGVAGLTWRRRRRRCASCGYDLEGLGGGVCPECGERVAKAL